MSTAPQRPDPSHAPANDTPETGVASVSSLPKKEAGKTKRSKRAWLIGAGLAALAVAAVVFVAHRGKESTDDAQVESDVVPVATRTSGQVLRVLVADDAAVKKGDLLLEIDPGEAAARVKQAEGELGTARAQADAADAQARVAEAGAKGGLTSARAQVSASSAGLSTAQAQISGAQAAVVRAESDARRTGLDLERSRKLRDANVISQERFDNAQAASEAARAQLDEARARLAAAIDGRRSAESRIADARGQLDSNAPIDAKIAVARANAALAHAKVTSAEAALDQARLGLGYTRVTAPQDGTISRFSVRTGQLVTPGTLVGELVPFDTYVMANFKETQVAHMKVGQKVEVNVDALDGKPLKGHVQSLAAGTGARFALLPPDNASGNFVKVVQRVPVRIAWDVRPEVPLRAGLSADVTVETRE